MAVGDRTKDILRNALRHLGTHGDPVLFSKDILQDALARVQRRICEESLCLKETADLNIYSGTELYDPPDGFLSERKVINSGSNPLVRRDMEDVDYYKRSFAASTTHDNTSDNLYFYYKWGGKIGFLVADGGPPTADSTVTIYYYRTADDSENPSDSLDPILERRWDTALFYGVVADLSGLDAWESKFNREFQRQKARESANGFETNQVQYDSTYD